MKLAQKVLIYKGFHQLNSVPSTLQLEIFGLECLMATENVFSHFNKTDCSVKLRQGRIVAILCRGRISCRSSSAKVVWLKKTCKTSSAIYMFYDEHINEKIQFF